MKHKLLLFSRILTGSFTFLFGLLWLNNLVSAVRFHDLLLSGHPEAAEHAEGFFSPLQWSTVDVSTVTTFVPFFGFLLFFAALFRFQRREEWPFFPGYERLNVALGLLGTIWGIILVGFYPVSEISIASLMKCLHTAMFSTLAAVGWVMVLMPLLLTPWSRKLLPGNTEEEDPREWEEILGKIYVCLRKNQEALTGMSREVSVFSGEMSVAQKVLETLAATASERAKEESRFRQEAAAAVSAFADAAQNWVVQLEALQKENRSLTQEKEKLSVTLADSCRTVSELQGKLDALKELLQ